MLSFSGSAGGVPHGCAPLELCWAKVLSLDRVAALGAEPVRCMTGLYSELAASPAASLAVFASNVPGAVTGLELVAAGVVRFRGEVPLTATP